MSPSGYDANTGSQRQEVHTITDGEALVEIRGAWLVHALLFRCTPVTITVIDRLG